MINIYDPDHRITKSHSAIEAEKYFDLALKTSDYNTGFK